MKKERLIPLFPIDYCRFLKSLLSHSKYFVKEETTLCGYKISKKFLIYKILTYSSILKFVKI